MSILITYIIFNLAALPTNLIWWNCVRRHWILTIGETGRVQCEENESEPLLHSSVLIKEIRIHYNIVSLFITCNLREKNPFGDSVTNTDNIYECHLQMQNINWQISFWQIKVIKSVLCYWNHICFHAKISLGKTSVF